MSVPDRLDSLETRIGELATVVARLERLFRYVYGGRSLDVIERGIGPDSATRGDGALIVFHGDHRRHPPSP